MKLLLNWILSGLQCIFIEFVESISLFVKKKYVNIVEVRLALFVKYTYAL